METIIRIGDKNKSEIIDWKNHIWNDNIKYNQQYMYNILRRKNIIIRNVDNFLLYVLNTCFLRNSIENNFNKEKPTLDDEWINEINYIPSISPLNCEVVESFNDGKEISLINDQNLIGGNFHNELMNKIMNDYYECLNFYGNDDN